MTKNFREKLKRMRDIEQKYRKTSDEYASFFYLQ